LRQLHLRTLEITDKEIILNSGGTQNKAALIGKDKRRLIEMQKIVNNYFRKRIQDNMTNLKNNLSSKYKKIFLKQKKTVFLLQVVYGVLVLILFFFLGFLFAF
jgi:hypothetical protein